jgi:hypothetical protein
MSFQELLARIFPSAFRTDRRALFLGLDASGRTRTLYMVKIQVHLHSNNRFAHTFRYFFDDLLLVQLKLGESVTTIPTIGFNVETVEHNQTSWTIWDVGGLTKKAEI